MSEWKVVDVPTVFPQMCIADGYTQKGPMVDTRREIQGMRVYLSQKSVDEAQRLIREHLGLPAEEGSKDFELAQARIAELQRDVDDVLEVANSLREERNQLVKRQEVHAQTILDQQARIAQLETALRTRAEAELAVAGGA